MPKLVIFDADGTLTPQRDGSCGEFSYTLLPGVADKVADLLAAGVQVGIASNQSKRRPVAEIREQLRWTCAELRIPADMWLYATTDFQQKPSPVMLVVLMSRAEVGPAETLFVGDQDTDRQAAENAGCGFAWAKDYFATEEK